MSANLADPSLRLDRLDATGALRAQLHMGGMPIGTARRGESTATVAAEMLTSLDSLPWLAPAGAGTAVEPAARYSAARERTGLFLHVGLAAAALALLGGGVWVSAENMAATPAPSVQQAHVVNAAPSEPPAAPARIAAATGVTAEEQQTLAEGAARPERETAAARTKPAAATQRSAGTLPPVTRIVPEIAPAQAVPNPATSSLPPPPPPVADSPVTNATLRQYRAAMDKCRDAIRAIIRLGDRQRPGRDATTAELASYRLRQQNAGAAKTYRTYIDTLGNTARGTNSETLTRQSLERARQTLGYLETMLADSKAALR